MTGQLAGALENVFQPEVLLVIVLAAAYGLFVGAIPGLTATMAVALLVPLTLHLPDVPALAAIVTLEACAIFAGDVPNTLVRIPGTPSSAAYTDDAYGLTRQGRSQTALGISLLFSVAGGLFGAVVLIAVAPQLAAVATNFGFFEEFLLYVLGVSCAIVVSRGSLLKGALALAIGLVLASVGLSAVHSAPRFTFGHDELMRGVNPIPAMIGLFGLSEVLRNVLRPGPEFHTGGDGRSGDAPDGGGTGAQHRLVVRFLWEPARAVFGAAVPLFVRRSIHTLRSSSIGCLVGMLPGAGADIGAWISYAVSKRLSKKPAEYGRGSVEGLGDATAANNSALAGAWIPTLVFGIPGDSVTAIVIGVLLMKNVTPGPQIFEKQGVLVYGIYITFIVANLVLIPLGFLLIRAGGLVVRVPRRVLMSLIVIFCIVGSYAINASYVDVGIMLAMGVLGFVLERYDVPLGPVVLAIILGGPLEAAFIRCLTQTPTPAGFFAHLLTRPYACVLAALCLVLWLFPLLSLLWRRRQRPG